MKIKERSDCKNCKVRDFIEHFFYDCDLVKPLWAEIEKELESHLQSPIKLIDRVVLLGATDEDIKTNTSAALDTINHAIIVGKLSISKFKYGPARSLLEIFQSECNLRRLWKHSDSSSENRHVA